MNGSTSSSMASGRSVIGGVPLPCLYDNPRTQVLGRRERQVLCHPLFEDFARYYGFTTRACQPSRAQTKGEAEFGVKYFRRNSSMAAPSSTVVMPSAAAR
jgi:transposase